MRAAALFLLLVAAFANAQGEAAVTYRDGRGPARTETLTVIEDAWSGLVVRLPGTAKSQKTIAADALVAVDYLSAPPVLKRARRAGSTLEWQSAAVDLETALASGAKLDPGVEHDLLFALWDVHVHLGRVDDKAAVEKRLEAKYPKGRAIPVVALARAAETAGLDDLAAARQAYAAVRARAQSEGWSRDSRGRAAAGEMLAIVELGDHAAAVALFEDFRRSADGQEDTALWVDYLRASTFSAQKNHKEARAAFEKAMALTKDEDRTLRAALSLAIGKAAGELGDWNAALLELSRAPSLYADDAALVHEVGAAYWLWADSYRRAAAALPKTEVEKKRVYEQRFRQLRQRAAAEYPLTRGGRRARQDMGS